MSGGQKRPAESGLRLPRIKYLFNLKYTRQEIIPAASDALVIQ